MRASSRRAMRLYKTVITLDAPLQLAGKAIQGTWRRLLGQDVEADRSWLAARGMWHFLARSLPEFWRA